MANRVAEYFSQIKNWKLFGYFKTSVPVHPEDDLTRTLGRFEKYLFHIQSILIWEDPLISTLSILGVNFIYWFLVNSGFRFYGVLFTTALFFFAHEMWMQQIWPEISIQLPDADRTDEWTPQHPSGVLSVPEISSYLMQAKNLVKNYYSYLRTLREEQPAVFCGQMCGVFSLLAVVGRTIPGPVILYCLIMAVMVGPGVYIHVLPPWAVEKLANLLAFLRGKTGKESDSEVEDMLPEATNENLALFELAGDQDNSDKEDTNEFGFDPSSSLTALTFSLQPDDSSLDDLDDLDLSPPHVKSEAGIHFRSSHFNGDDSSDEEESAFAQGMTFTDSPAPQPATHAGPTLMDGLTHGLANLGASLVSSVMLSNRAPPPVPMRRHSSSDNSIEDFEIINTEELS